LTNKTSLKERGGDVENAPEKESHSFFTPSRRRRRRRRTHTRRHGRRRTPATEPCALHLSLYDGGGNKRAVSRRTGVCHETRLALPRMRNERASVLRRVRSFGSFIFIFLRTSFERHLVKPRCIIRVCLNSIHGDHRSIP
jgi:hypothetical protein